MTAGAQACAQLTGGMMTTQFNGKRALLWAAFLTLIVAFALPSMAFGQGRGRGRGRSNDKCDKFVNCHDASEGRVDGRGPRTDRDDDYYDDDNYRRDRGRNRRN